ncbi:MAG TPA: cyclase family protein [Steroidobacteraceae bacterium]|nr:cyclase family protein [Steroidobacteraceae bacterium]
MPSSKAGAGRARLAFGARELATDFSRGTSLAIEQRFGTAQLRCFGAPPARSAPLVVGSFNGSVARGASCNCSTFTLTPHCNGTHTECVGHLTRQALDVIDVMPRAPVLALLVSVQPQPDAATGDALVTAAALRRAWRGELDPAALVIRTLPNDADKRTRDYDHHPAPYLAADAARFVVERDIEHLVLDLPSADRAEDSGLLTAHRLFFGLPPGSTALADSRRAHCTLTELAFVDDRLADGWYLLSLQCPALGGDAVPSRPVLYPVLDA